MSDPPISIWCNPIDDEYHDKIIYDSKFTVIVKYFGQTLGRMDRYIVEDSFFFFKNSKKDLQYKYIGKVISVNKLGKENDINVFELVIKKGDSISFRVKKDACEYFNWNPNGQINGIHRHKRKIKEK